MNQILPLRRRSFIASLTAGAFTLGWQIPRQAEAAVGAGSAVGIWAVIHPDDTVVVRIARSEMGQGSFTGLSQLVADELDCDWKHVRAEYVAPDVNFAHDHAWGDMSTGGSRGIRGSVDYVREGGAVARAMLIQAAANAWGVSPDSCSAARSVVTHVATGRNMRYGELAEAAAKLPVPTGIAVKDPSKWTIIGQPVKRLDTVEKLNGSQVFAIDVQLPDMLCAAIAQCPVFGGTLVSFDADKITAMPGVRHVLKVDNHTVAVVADKWYLAKTAMAKLPIVWDEGPNAKVNSAQIYAHLQTGLDATDASPGVHQGDIAAGLASAAKTVQAVYTAPFVSHATLEPMNCTAKVTKDGIVEIWVPSQNGDAALAVAAAAAELPKSAVRVNKLHLGGGFGRRGQQDYVRQAVLIAKQIPDRPVKMIWSREEDMQHDFFRPVSQAKFTAGLDAQGNLTTLHARISGQSIDATNNPATTQAQAAGRQMQSWSSEEFGYRHVPNLLLDYAMRNTHVPVGPWRGVNSNQNAFFLECFIDELAHAAGKDPLEFRQALLAKSPLHLGVLNAVAEKAEWQKPLPPGVFRGIAQNCGYGSYVAAVAEVTVSPKGELKVLRIVAATDPGHIVNPDQVRAQVEGSFVYGLSAGLTSEITIENGRVAEGNFDRYEVMRLAAMPKVETVLAPSGGFWGGVGEPTIAVATPAVMNAIFAATGKRVRGLPLKNTDLTKA
jgi:isoquinoline 1-oxidoreductase beta subunit